MSDELYTPETVRQAVIQMSNNGPGLVLLRLDDVTRVIMDAQRRGMIAAFESSAKARCAAYPNPCSVAGRHCNARFEREIIAELRRQTSPIETLNLAVMQPANGCLPPMDECKRRQGEGETAK